ncbi:uncharacterized protein [Labrus bergylta]|uniref:uncharacterized protein n=1 Tax=Labrus bergylta TaxID=56723 RepID=UPI0009B35924|nr:uncharacterized protein LOC109994583 [Labrus bergylta]XP_020503661.1 uncharacterized protein LOC109994583 [Labrus bergylta]
MGRLDEAAKQKVVELRKAGLSFRKIKAVLELENIKVSAQAIYLYLREFQGRPPGRVRPLEAGSSTSQAHVHPRAGAAQESWNNIHLQNLLREASQHAGFAAAANFAKQTPTNAATGAKPSGSGVTGCRSEQQPRGDKEENDIQIVSVTSLAQNSQQRSPQSTVTRANTGPVSSTLTASGAVMRRRVTPSPATNPMLAARKRLLDKALSQKMKSFHQMASLLRRDHLSVQGPSTVSQPSETYDLTNDKTVMEDQPGGATAPRRFLTQRPGPSARTLHPLPRVGIRLPNQSPSPLTPSAPGVAVIRLQTPGGQGATRSEGNPSPHQAVQDAGVRGGLQDQIKTLGTEVHSLGLAVKMLVEQQCRLEREQAQQTHIQKQILITLQSFTSKIGHCSTVQQPQNKTPSLCDLPVSASASFSQDTFNFSQGTYSQCSQTQPSFNSLESLDHAEAFKLPGLSPSSMNGFPTCSNAENLPLTHTPPITQTYAAAYPQQSNSQALIPTYTQSYVSTYSQPHSQTFRGSENKASDFPSSCSARTLQDCSVSTQPMMNSEQCSQDQQINIIKVEGP